MFPTAVITRCYSCCAALLMLGFMTQAAAADPIRFMRDPHVANGMITFSYYGDIWIANVDGTGARRLTSNIARDIAPRFSPDGEWVAFSSNRFGNNDVFLIPVSGGEPSQLTFHSGNDVVAGWTPDGQHVNVHHRPRNASFLFTHVYRRSIGGHSCADGDGPGTERHDQAGRNDGGVQPKTPQHD
jgi:tricorn protease